MLVGGIAAIYYGEPRSTQDLDVIINVRESETSKVNILCELFRESDFRIIGGCEAILEAVKKRIHVTIYDRDYMYRVDLQGVYNRLNELAFEGRRRMIIFGEEAWIQGQKILLYQS